MTFMVGTPANFKNFLTKIFGLSKIAVPLLYSKGEIGRLERSKCNNGEIGI